MSHRILALALYLAIASCTPAPPPPSLTGQPEATPTPESLTCSPSADQADCNNGDDGEVSWQSCAVPLQTSQSDFCIVHTVSITAYPTARYVNWPKAGIHSSIVRDGATVSRCCFRYVAPESDTLEHSISPPRRLETTVFVGIGEFSDQRVLTTFVEGLTEFDGSPVNLQFLVASSVVPLPQGPAYQYAIDNQGSPIIMSWYFSDSAFIGDIFSEQGAGDFPITLGQHESAFAFSAYFDAPTQLGTPFVTILDPLGQPLFTVSAPAFRPAP